MKTAKWAIIGAGVAGLEAARVLGNAGHEVVVFEKARGVGGRLATRRISGPEGGAEAHFDFGAQFFSSFSVEFQERLMPALRSGLVTEWFQKNSSPRYRVKNGMTALAKEWARTIRIQPSARITRLVRGPSGLNLEFEKPETIPNRDLSFEGVLVTAPVPQALDLLDGSAQALLGAPPSERILPWESLRNVRYHPCIALMILVRDAHLGEKRQELEQCGYLDSSGQGLEWGWIASNGDKGLVCPPGWRSLTVHFAPEFSQEWLEQIESPAFDQRCVEALIRSRVLSATAKFQDLQVVKHRWRYSLPAVLHPERHFITQIKFADPQAPGILAVAGDAFQGARVEGAFLSGRSAAQAMLQALTSRA